jgi:signal recognition particle GTPase
MVDHELHVENFLFLRDRLIGTYSYQVKTREEEQQTTRVSKVGAEAEYTTRNEKGEKTIFNEAKCFKKDQDYHMSDEEALLCPAFSRGFTLSDKRWACFLVEDVQDIKYDKKAFEKVQIDERTKEAIQALVERHDEVSQDFVDHVSGKGKGLIVSLEGPPGSGKTMTPGKFLVDFNCTNICGLSLRRGGCGAESMSSLHYRHRGAGHEG